MHLIDFDSISTSSYTFCRSHLPLSYLIVDQQNQYIELVFRLKWFQQLYYFNFFFSLLVCMRVHVCCYSTQIQWRSRVLLLICLQCSQFTKNVGNYIYLKYRASDWTDTQTQRSCFICSAQPHFGTETACAKDRNNSATHFQTKTL